MRQLSSRTVFLDGLDNIGLRYTEWQGTPI